MPRSIQDKKAAPGSNQEPHLKHYEAGLRLMQEGKYDKARAEFEKLSPDGPPEIRDRAALHLAACQRQAQRVQLTFSTIEERYDFAVLLLNDGNYEDAREHLEIILVEKEDADFAHYGVAVLNSVTGQAEECLTHLARAIELNPINRIQARRDTDFADMADDPRFTELLYPEIY
jgi:tetratricopeptide (TPR) repeat protein